MGPLFRLTWRRVGVSTIIALAMVSGTALGPLGSPPGTASAASPRVVVTSATHDLSPPLRSIPRLAPPVRTPQTVPLLLAPVPITNSGAGPDTLAAQPAAAAKRQWSTVTVAGASFEGMGNGLSGYGVRRAPPDPNGAVGPNHYVQVVNSTLAVFSKSGTVLLSPVETNTLYSGFGGSCEQSSAIDPIVLHDQIADRWLVGYSGGGSAPAICLALSQTGDPTGSYYRYAFPSPYFDDYSKLAVWPDAYYLSGNDNGARLWAFDRARMLSGLAATAQSFNLPNDYSLLPANLDGSTLPSSGSPAYFVNIGSSTSLNLWKFHVDWAMPARSTLSPPSSIAVAAFTPLCSGAPGFFDCIPQRGTTQRLEALSDRLMYRLAYRNFGNHESLVVNHSVAAGPSGGVRWYELRSPGTTPVVFQQGTYAPDSDYRWMGSIAMDRLGDIAVGYSLSGPKRYPSIGYTGRLVRDPLGTLQLGVHLVDGTGAQLPTLDRWGDYSSLAIDPTDDCTFWYTTEYLTTSGTFNWHTRVGSFKVRTC